MRSTRLTDAAIHARVKGRENTRRVQEKTGTIYTVKMVKISKKSARDKIVTIETSTLQRLLTVTQEAQLCQDSIFTTTYVRA